MQAGTACMDPDSVQKGLVQHKMISDYRSGVEAVVSCSALLSASRCELGISDIYYTMMLEKPWNNDRRNFTFRL